MKDTAKALKLDIVLKRLKINKEPAVGFVIRKFFRMNKTENAPAYEE